MTVLALLIAVAFPVTQTDLDHAFGDRPGAMVVTDVETGETLRHNPGLCAEPLPPCSTFKIWNSAIGFETGVLKEVDQPFWKWDGEKRFIPDWNQDLDLRGAFRASCVPAFQALARQIGREQMVAWLAKLDYGNQDISSGLDVFWLPAPDITPILISADEQAQLITSLLKGALPLSSSTRDRLAELMKTAEFKGGTLHGKTGTGDAGKSSPTVGWYVGWFDTGTRKFAFACVLTGPGASGKNARAVVETLFGK